MNGMNPMNSAPQEHHSNSNKSGGGMVYVYKNAESLPFEPQYPYNGTTITGGNSLTHDLNIYYTTGDEAWMLMATILVMLQIPGFGFFYSGLARRKSALQLLFTALMSTAVVTFQWFFWGYSLSFSHHVVSNFVGKLDNFGYMGVLAQPSVGGPKTPDLTFSIFQLMFAALTVAIATGAVAERARVLPCIIFMFLWTTLVYDFVACWTWNMMGWQWMLGGLDFAGGGPVHIQAGVTALIYSWKLGSRRGWGTQELNYRPHNVAYIVLGTVFIWLGWFGFDAGSAFGSNLRAVMAFVVTNISGSVGGITWCLIDYRLERKWSTVGFCSGVVAGLVCVTPASGYVPPWSAVIFGIVGGGICNFGTKLKFYVHSDDALDIFAIHGVGGFTGNILTAFFAADYIAHLDGYTTIPGGWLNHHWIQLGYQLADSVSDILWCSVMTYIILYIIDWIPGLHLRATEEEEVLGMDDVELGEFIYDYVDPHRDVSLPTTATLLENSGIPQRSPTFPTPEAAFASVHGGNKAIAKRVAAERSATAREKHLSTLSAISASGSGVGSSGSGISGVVKEGGEGGSGNAI